MKKLATLIPILLFLFFSSAETWAQQALNPRPSPMYIATVKYDDTYVKVTYCRPHKRDRVVFGGDLVPYGKVWRTGANEATEITFTKDVILAGNKVEAGTYTLFTIPEKNKWTVILNSDLGQWGAYNYNPEKDVIHFDAQVAVTEEVYEPFTIEFQLQDKVANLVMMWDKTKAWFPIEFVD